MLCSENLHVLHPLSQKLPGVFLRVVAVHAGKYCDKCWSKKAAQFHAIYIGVCTISSNPLPPRRHSAVLAGWTHNVRNLGSHLDAEAVQLLHTDYEGRMLKSVFCFL